MTTQNRQIGSILIEALIALVVLALGIVAIAKLQGSFMRSGADAQSRNVALKLAQQNIDKLRAYNQISGTTVYPTTRPFEMIVSNSAYETVGNAGYSISWTVSNFDGTGSVVAPTSIGDTSYKKVNMRVTWTDIGGTSQSRVELNSYIAKINAYGSKALADAGIGGPGPQVLYNPGVAPDVIAIDTDGESTETTLPEPAIKKIASSDYFYSQFETVTYTGGNVELRNEEFLNIRCECEYDTSNYIDQGFPVARSIWHPSHENDVDEHTHYVASFFHPDANNHAFIAQTESGRADFLGEMITKVIGQSAVGASAQHPFCNICCRDHHDANASFINSHNTDTDNKLKGAYACDPSEDLASAGTYTGDRSKCADPWRPTSDYDGGTGDHKHYTAAGDEVEPGHNDTYLEACRLKRINGKFSVFQDWHLHGSTYVAAAEDAFTPGVVNNVVTDYKQYIKDYVEAVIANADNLPITMTTTFHNPATDYVWPPSGFTGYPTSKQFIARGIYMDYLDKFTLDKLNDVRINQPGTFFENAPFNEINLTRLSDWQPECVTSGGARASALTYIRNVNASPVSNKSCVTNFGLAATQANSASEIQRGLLGLVVNDSFQFTTNILLSNTGIIGINDFLPESNVAVTYPTSDDRSYDIAFVSNSRQFGTATGGIHRDITINAPGGWNPSNTTVLSSAANNGGSITGGANGNGWLFSLNTSTTPWTGTITITLQNRKETGPPSNPTITITNCTGTSSQSSITGSTGTISITCN